MPYKCIINLLSNQQGVYLFKMENTETNFLGEIVYLEQFVFVRDTALQIILQLNTGHSRARDLLDKTIREQKLVDPEKSFLAELVYGSIRRRGNLDWIISQLVHRGKLARLKPEIVEILRLGLYQIMFLNSVPEYAAVNESVKLAKKYGNIGLAGLVNAVLRQAVRIKDSISYPDIQANPVKHVASKYSHPEWMVKRWIKRFGVSETIQLCSANNLHAPLYIRANFLKITRDKLIHELEKEGATVVASQNIDEGIKFIELNSTLNELSSFKQGWFQVQDESSMFASHILDPQPGEFIIDLCAAPGGKTTHIGEIMQNRGKILAFDIDSRRLSLLTETCERLGITIVQAIEADARKLDEHIEKADRVLVDAPCAGLGVLRRRIETRWRRQLEELKIFPETQYEILSSASNYVKPSGVLVYCTCTIEPEENQQVVEKFLKSNTEFYIEKINIPALEKIGGISPEGYMQTYPHKHDMDGFFAARMRRGVI